MSKNSHPQVGRRVPVRGLIALAVVFGGVLMAACVNLTGIGTVIAADPEPKRIFLIGATANAAPEFINQALAAGHEIIGLALRPEAVEIEHERFTVVKGDVYDLDSIENALTGDEIVVSYLDVSLPFRVEIVEQVDLFSRGTANIIQAMKNKGNRRLVVVSTIGVTHVVLDKPSDDAPIGDKISWEKRNKYDDQRRMEAIVKSSDLDHIMLRVPNLVEESSTGKYNVVVSQNNANLYEKLTNGDLAAFILKHLDTDEYLGTTLDLFN